MTGHTMKNVADLEAIYGRPKRKQISSHQRIGLNERHYQSSHTSNGGRHHTKEDPRFNGGISNKWGKDTFLNKKSKGAPEVQEITTIHVPRSSSTSHSNTHYRKHSTEGSKMETSRRSVYKEDNTDARYVDMRRSHAGPTPAQRSSHSINGGKGSQSRVILTPSGGMSRWGKSAFLNTSTKTGGGGFSEKKKTDGLPHLSSQNSHKPGQTVRRDDHLEARFSRVSDKRISSHEHEIIDDTRPAQRTSHHTTNSSPRSSQMINNNRTFPPDGSHVDMHLPIDDYGRSTKIVVDDHQHTGSHHRFSDDTRPAQRISHHSINSSPRHSQVQPSSPIAPSLPKVHNDGGIKIMFDGAGSKPIDLHRQKLPQRRHQAAHPSNSSSRHTTKSIKLDEDPLIIAAGQGSYYDGNRNNPIDFKQHVDFKDMQLFEFPHQASHASNSVRRQTQPIQVSSGSQIGLNAMDDDKRQIDINDGNRNNPIDFKQHVDFKDMQLFEFPHQASHASNSVRRQTQPIQVGSGSQTSLNAMNDGRRQIDINDMQFLIGHQAAHPSNSIHQI